jgi:hypothetical protein
MGKTVLGLYPVSFCFLFCRFIYKLCRVFEEQTCALIWCNSELGAQISGIPSLHAHLLRKWFIKCEKQLLQIAHEQSDRI